MRGVVREERSGKEDWGSRAIEVGRHISWAGELLSGELNDVRRGLNCIIRVGGASVSDDLFDRLGTRVDGGKVAIDETQGDAGANAVPSTEAPCRVET